MTRVKGGPRAHRAHRKVIKLAKGYRGSRSKNFRRAQEAVLRAGERAFAGRKQRRRDMRSLWIVRINAALTQYDIKYSRFIKALSTEKVDLNRKVLADMAQNDAKAFEAVVNKVRGSIKN